MKKVTINTTKEGLSVHVDSKKIEDVKSFQVSAEDNGEATLTVVKLAKNEQGSHYITGGGDDRSLATERLTFTGSITVKGEGDEPADEGE